MAHATNDNNSTMVQHDWEKLGKERKAGLEKGVDGKQGGLPFNLAI